MFTNKYSYFKVQHLGAYFGAVGKTTLNHVRYDGKETLYMSFDDLVEYEARKQHLEQLRSSDEIKRLARNRQ